MKLWIGSSAGRGAGVGTRSGSRTAAAPPWGCRPTKSLDAEQPASKVWCRASQWPTSWVSVSPRAYLPGGAAGHRLVEHHDAVDVVAAVVVALREVGPAQQPATDVRGVDVEGLAVAGVAAPSSCRARALPGHDVVPLRRVSTNVVVGELEAERRVRPVVAPAGSARPEKESLSTFICVWRPASVQRGVRPRLVTPRSDGSCGTDGRDGAPLPLSHQRLRLDPAVRLGVRVLGGLLALAVGRHASGRRAVVAVGVGAGGPGRRWRTRWPSPRARRRRRAGRRWPRRPGRIEASSAWAGILRGGPDISVEGT